MDSLGSSPMVLLSGGAVEGNSDNGQFKFVKDTFVLNLETGQTRQLFDLPRATSAATGAVLLGRDNNFIPLVCGGMDPDHQSFDECLKVEKDISFGAIHK